MGGIDGDEFIQGWICSGGIDGGQYVTEELKGGIARVPSVDPNLLLKNDIPLNKYVIN